MYLANAISDFPSRKGNISGDLPVGIECRDADAVLRAACIIIKETICAIRIILRKTVNDSRPMVW
jgi:hypothetical protein